MKKSIFAVAVLLLFIGLGIGEQIYLNKLFNGISENISDVRASIETGEMEKALKKANETMETWERKKHFTDAIISHNETREVSLRLSELQGYVSAQDDKSAIATAAIIQELCDNLKHILGFKWDTIM